MSILYRQLGARACLAGSQMLSYLDYQVFHSLASRRMHSGVTILVHLSMPKWMYWQVVPVMQSFLEQGITR